MAVKQSGRASRVTPDELIAPELAPPADAEVTKAVDADAEVTPPVEKGYVNVRPVKSYMFDPFQRISIMEGVDTPVQLTSWIQAQLDAKLLETC